MARIQIPLTHIVELNGANLVQQADCRVLTTARGQWHYSAQLASESPSSEPAIRTVLVRLQIQSGVIGLGWLDETGQQWVARAVGHPTADPVEISLNLPQGHVGGRLIFDNATEGDRPAIAVIHGIVFDNTTGDSAGGPECDAADAVTRIFASFNPTHLPNPAEIAELEAHSLHFAHDKFLSFAPDNGVLRNFATSIWEFAHGETELKSFPWNISLPVADLCNARCTFCTSWLDGRKVLDLDKLDMFEPVLRNALYIGLVGHGEPMAHPRFDELCDRLEKLCDPMSSVYTITNGSFLDKWRDHLERINLHSYSISLNAATAKTHEQVMGIGEDAFPRIVDSIAQLIAGSRKLRIPRNVYITMVVNQQNIAEVPAFIDLGNRLGVTEIWLRTLLPQPQLIPGLNYQLLPPYLHPNFERLRRSAIAAIRASSVPVQADPALWSQPLFSETLERQIMLKPPPLISRDDALRDRDLRRRNQFLYTQEEGTFRGQVLPEGANSEVRWAGGCLHVLTPKGAGAYAAALRVTYPVEADEQLLSVEVDATCQSGVLAFGLLDEQKNQWLDRVNVEPGSGHPVTVKASVHGQPLQLIVHNGGDGSAPARGQVGEARIRVEGIGQALPIEWETLTIHNAADPLDDGTNPLGRQARFSCKAVYYNLYVNEFFWRINPCCYLQQVPGFQEVRLDGDMTFSQAWNSPGMVQLRHRLADGPLFGACVRCPEKW